MSWFSHVSRGSDHQQSTDNQTLLATNFFASACSPVNPPERSAAASGSCAPSPGGFPPAPRGAVDPLRPESHSCASPSAAREPEPEPISYVSLQEQRCVLSWFQGWTAAQRERFLQDLLGKAVPGKVCTLLGSLSTLQVKDKLPNIFECQLRLWTQWFDSWREEERNHFLHILEERDPEFVAHFYRSVAGTAGRD